MTIEKVPESKVREMRRLREQGLTLEEIGKRMVPNISRERVRQLIGNTGGGRYEKKESEKS